MPKRRAVLDISPSRLELAVLSGGDVVTSRVERIEVVEYAEAWPRCLETLSQQLAALVKAAGAEDLPTTVLYHSPSAVVLVSPVPATTSAARAVQAASLALAEAANRPLDEHPHDLERIWKDADSSGPETSPSQAHVLGMCDSEEAAATVAHLVRGAGLHPTGLVPAECTGVVAAVDAALEQSSASPGTVIALWCGEHASTLVAAIGGRLKFVRRIGMGTEMLVDALAREVKTSSGTVTLTRTQAATLLARNGIPARGQPFDAELGIGADAVLPLIQPVIQRCIVEIKQSLRFGLGEGERAGARLVVLGIGARIGRLFQVIAEQSALAPTDTKVQPSAEAPTSTADGLIHHQVNGRQIAAVVCPAFLRREQTARRARRGMLVGFSAAAALIALSAVSARMELGAQLKRVDQAKANLESSRPITDLNLRMLAAQAGVAQAHQRIANRLATAAVWDGALVLLSQSTPEAIRINECQMNFERGKPVARISGQMRLPPTGDANAIMRGYLDALAAIPLVKSTRLGQTQRIDSDWGPVQSFEMSIVLIDLPAYSDGSLLANVVEEEETP